MTTPDTPAPGGPMDPLLNKIVHGLAREMRGSRNPDVVRANCAFCGRERSRKDDNHAPNCAYWVFFPDGGEQ